MATLVNLPSNNFNRVYTQFPVYQNVPYQLNTIARPMGPYGNVPFPLKALKRAYIAQRLQAATGQVKLIY